MTPLLLGAGLFLGGALVSRGSKKSNGGAGAPPPPTVHVAATHARAAAAASRTAATPSNLAAIAAKIAAGPQPGDYLAQQLTGLDLYTIGKPQYAVLTDDDFPDWHTRGDSDRVLPPIPGVHTKRGTSPRLQLQAFYDQLWRPASVLPLRAVPLEAWQTAYAWLTGQVTQWKIARMSDGSLASVKDIGSSYDAAVQGWQALLAIDQILTAVGSALSFGIVGAARGLIEVGLTASDNTIGDKLGDAQRQAAAAAALAAGDASTWPTVSASDLWIIAGGGTGGVQWHWRYKWQGADGKPLNLPVWEKIAGRDASEWRAQRGAPIGDLLGAGISALGASGEFVDAVHDLGYVYAHPENGEPLLLRDSLFQSLLPWCTRSVATLGVFTASGGSNVASSVGGYENAYAGFLPAMDIRTWVPKWAAVYRAADALAAVLFPRTGKDASGAYVPLRGSYSYGVRGIGALIGSVFPPHVDDEPVDLPQFNGVKVAGHPSVAGSESVRLTDILSRL